MFNTDGFGEFGISKAVVTREIKKDEKIPVFYFTRNHG